MSTNAAYSHTDIHTHRHTHDDSIRRHAMRCMSLKNEVSILINDEVTTNYNAHTNTHIHTHIHTHTHMAIA